MKLDISKIVYLLLITLVGISTAQRCAGRPRIPSCLGPRNIGRRGFRCSARNMWYYDAATRQCRQMRYRGCGGNSNRWCSMAHCRSSCVR